MNEDPWILSSRSSSAMETRDDLWKECGWRMRQLHMVARKLRASRFSESQRGIVLLRVVLRTMESLRQFTNDAVLLSNREGISHNDVGVLADAAEIAMVVCKVVGCECPTLAKVDEDRKLELQKELAATDALQVSHNLRRDQVDGLRLVVMSLREREQSQEFHRGLLLGVKGLAGKLDSYSTDNFAYGMTPLQTWMRLCMTATIQSTIHKRRIGGVSKIGNNEATDTSSGRRVVTPCVILGSSSGSLVFFTSILLGIECSGVEIVPFLHQVAEEIKNQHKIPGVRFVEGDMLTMQLHNARVVILTSQCWDQDLYARVMHKLERELEPTALVVDYRDGLTRSTYFALAETVEDVPVSWNREHKLRIYKRRHEPT